MSCGGDLNIGDEIDINFDNIQGKFFNNTEQDLSIGLFLHTQPELDISPNELVDCYFGDIVNVASEESIDNINVELEPSSETQDCQMVISQMMQDITPCVLSESECEVYLTVASVSNDTLLSYIRFAIKAPYSKIQSGSGIRAVIDDIKIVDTQLSVDSAGNFYACSIVTDEEIKEVESKTSAIYILLVLGSIFLLLLFLIIVMIYAYMVDE